LCSAVAAAGVKIFFSFLHFCHTTPLFALEGFLPFFCFIPIHFAGVVVINALRALSRRTNSRAVPSNLKEILALFAAFCKVNLIAHFLHKPPEREFTGMELIMHQDILGT
jgi:hypothetical protein